MATGEKFLRPNPDDSDDKVLRIDYLFPLR